MENLYSILGVGKDASQSQIEDAYNNLKDSLKDNFTAISKLDAAYRVLSNIDMRAYYDVHGRIPAKKTHEKRSATDDRSVLKVRKILNSIFLLGAVVSVVFFVLQYAGCSVVPFYIACGTSMLIKIAEYALRLF